MKKTIALFLVMVMMCMFCAPMTAFAVNLDTLGTLISGDVAVTVSDRNDITGVHTITGTVTVEQDAVLTIARGATIVVADSGKIVNNGTIVVENGGTLNLTATGSSTIDAALYIGETGKLTVKSTAACLVAKDSYVYNAGVIENADVIVNNGTIKHKVQIPEIGSVTYKYTETWNRQDITVDFQVAYYMYGVGDDDLAYRNDEIYTSQATEWVENGNTIFITIIPESGDGDWIDTTRMKLVVNGQVLEAMDVTNKGYAVFKIQPTSAVSTSVYSTSYKDIVKIFIVELPNNESYYVITSNDEVNTAKVEYGKVLSFRVILNPDYDKSADSVVVYVNSYPLVDDVFQSGMTPGANEFGYYDISTNTKGEIITEGGVQSDISITVMGVAPNSRIDTMTSIVSFIQEIFAVIKSIFDYFKDIFSGLGNLGQS